MEKINLLNILSFINIFSLVSILGWSLAQIKIDLNLVEYKVGWPIYIFDRYRAVGFMPNTKYVIFLSKFYFFNNTKI